MSVLLILLVVLVVAAFNLFAIFAGEDEYGSLHNAASVVGGLGLVLLLSLPIVVLYVGADYATNPLKSYSAMALVSLAVLALLTSLASLVLAIVISKKKCRDKN